MRRAQRHEWAAMRDVGRQLAVVAIQRPTAPEELTDRGKRILSPEPKDKCERHAPRALEAACGPKAMHEASCRNSAW